MAAKYEDVQRYSKAVRTAINLAQRDMLKVYLALVSEGASVEDARKALQAASQAIVRKYGNVAGAAALEYYRALQEGDVTDFEPSIADDTYSAGVASSARWAVGGETEAETVSRLMQMTEFYVKGYATDTMASNAIRDPRATFFARVPTGATTCDFCITLASRGFAYASAETAGMFKGFHENCDCQVVASYSDGIDGYDPNLYLDIYRNGIVRQNPDAMGDEARAYYERSVEARKARRRELYAMKKAQTNAD